MEKERAKEIAIELAKAAIESPAGGAIFYINSDSADHIADFIERLTNRLSDQ